jgi:hypothetical protein
MIVINEQMEFLQRDGHYNRKPDENSRAERYNNK